MSEIVLRQFEWPNSERSTLFINLNDTYINSNENFIDLKIRKREYKPKIYLTALKPSNLNARQINLNDKPATLAG